MKTKIRINADDFGISPGCNSAVLKALAGGCLNSVSILATGDFLTDDAVTELRRVPELNCGVHLNLSYGRSLTRPPHLSRHGIFHLSFVALLLKSLFSPSLRREIESEWEAQINALRQRGISLAHLDSHRHVHLIPWLYAIAIRLAERYSIPEVRHARESLLFSLRLGRSLRLLRNGGIIKWLVLQACGLFCPRRTERKLFSVLYTGEIHAEMIQRLWQNPTPQKLEIILHPGIPELDRNIRFHTSAEQFYRLSPKRRQELQIGQLSLKCPLETTNNKTNES